MTVWPALWCIAPDAASAASDEVASLRDAVAAALPGVSLRVLPAGPDGVDLTAELARVPRADHGLAAILSPLALDGAEPLAAAVTRAATSRPDVIATAPWGHDPCVVAAVLDRLSQSHVEPGATVVLAATPTPTAAVPEAVLAIAEALRIAWGGPVRIGLVPSADAAPDGPGTVAAAVRAARAYGEEGTVAVVPLALVPGPGAAIDPAGAHVVTSPLVPHPALAAAIADAYVALVHANPREAAPA